MIGNNVISFDLIDSTNNYIKLNLSKLKSGDIVTSEIQTLGRGRADHLWISEKGDLFFSFLIKDVEKYSEVFDYLSRVSVSVVEVLRQFGIKAKIKYPNDILVEDKKICGILIETSGSSKPENIIVGVGININNNKYKDINYKATSFKVVLGNEFDIRKVLDMFIIKFNELTSLDRDIVYRRYLTYSMVIGKRVIIEGLSYNVLDITTSGELLLEGVNGMTRKSLNEISLEELYET